MTVTLPHRRRSPTTPIWLLPAVGFAIVLAPVVLLAGAGNPPCTSIAPSPTGFPAGTGAWIATAYGPPWGGIQGNGITATGLNLTAGRPAYEIAVDPTAVPLQSFAHVTPNPFDTRHAFYAGDTGGAIIGRHVDIYDWEGRGAQDAWGQRHVTVTPAPNPGAGSLLGEITPTATATQPPSSTAGGGARGCSAAGGPLALTPGQTAKILPSGLAAAPQDAPRAVKLAIAAGNQLIDKPYIYGGGHGPPLTELDGGYDCSGSTSFVLHGAGVFGDYAEDSTELESYGQAGPGQWISVYANSAHAFIAVAGIVLDTAWYAPVQPTSPGSGPRWQPASIIPAQYAGDEAAGNGGFVQRHPAGL
jgi:3D (Asp-Asp-Asp) domain-containing protein